jgi:phenylpyruvate tautomerase PptA (4-oxalocrotonate tautomerase family)
VAAPESSPSSVVGSRGRKSVPASEGAAYAARSQVASPVGLPLCDIEELPMPHVTLYALEEELVGREPALIGELTSAVVSVYGEWARSSVDIRLIGIPAGRWARGGAPVATAAPSVTFGMREEVFARPDAARVIAQLVSAFTEAVTTVFGDACRDDVLVELVGQPTSRSGLGGKVIGDDKAT